MEQIDNQGPNDDDSSGQTAEQEAVASPQSCMARLESAVQQIENLLKLASSRKTVLELQKVQALEMTRNAMLVFRSNLEFEKESQRKSTQHDIELDLSHVVFNVGGKRFVVDASNWDLEGAGLLALLLRNPELIRFSRGGSIFLDCNFDHFQIIVDYLSGSRVTVPTEMIEDFCELASLFGLRQLVEQVRGTLHHKKLRRSTAPNDLSALPVSRQADLILAEATAALKLCQSAALNSNLEQKKLQDTIGQINKTDPFFVRFGDYQFAISRSRLSNQGGTLEAQLLALAPESDGVVRLDPQGVKPEIFSSFLDYLRGYYTSQNERKFNHKLAMMQALALRFGLQHFNMSQPHIVDSLKVRKESYEVYFQGSAKIAWGHHCAVWKFTYSGPGYAAVGVRSERGVEWLISLNTLARHMNARDLHTRQVFKSFQSNQRLVLLLEGTNLAIGTDTSDQLLLAFDSVIRQDTLFFIARSEKGTQVELL